MAIVQGRTRAQLRQSIGYNLNAIKTGTATGGTNNTLIDVNTFRGGDDNYNGKIVIVTDASDGTTQTTQYANDYTASNNTIQFQQNASFTVASGDTYEIWDTVYDPAIINDFINQAIMDATGNFYDPVENLSLHTDGKTQRFDIPSDFSMIQNIYYRSKVDFARLLSCNTAMDEQVDSNFTITADTKMKKQGTASNRIAITGSASAGDIATDSITSKDISQYTHIEFWIRSSVPTSAGNLRILLDDTANCASPLETLHVPALSADTWTFCRVALANPESDTAIISVGIEYDADLDACTVWLDDVSVAQWEKIPRNLWKIDKESSDIVLDNYAHGTARYNLLKIVGGDKPALLTTETATSEVDEQYIIARATALAFAATSGGPSTDPDDKNNMAGFWMGMSQQARRSFPLLTDVRMVN
jgi:hypothetical protein